MEKKSGNMAELSNSSLKNFAAAASALVLTQSLRFARNYRYYNSDSNDSVSRHKLITKIRLIRHLTFSLQNLMGNGKQEEKPYFVSITCTINDTFEEIHRDLLFFDSDEIVDIIPKIDQQRQFWAEFTEPEFYDSKLFNKLDHVIPDTLYQIEKNLLGLPPFASV